MYYDLPAPCYYFVGPFQNKEWASLQFKPYGITFSNCEPKPFSDYSCPNAASCPHEKKKKVSPKTFGHLVAIAKECIVGELSVKGTRNIWITFPFK